MPAKATTGITVPLKRDDTAPFEGYLIPPDQWVQLNQDLIEKDLLKKQVSVSQKESSFTQNFLWGFVAGSLTIILIDKYGSK